LLKILCY